MTEGLRTGIVVRTLSPTPAMIEVTVGLEDSQVCILLTVQNAEQLRAELLSAIQTAMMSTLDEDEPRLAS